jgi:hypothetical protein
MRKRSRVDLDWKNLHTLLCWSLVDPLPYWQSPSFETKLKGQDPVHSIEGKSIAMIFTFTTQLKSIWVTSSWLVLTSQVDSSRLVTWLDLAQVDFAKSTWRPFKSSCGNTTPGCIPLLSEVETTLCRWSIIFWWCKTSQFGHASKLQVHLFWASPWCRISQNTSFELVSCIYIRKADILHSAHPIPHDLRWSYVILLFTLFSMLQGHRDPSQGS